jgi:hypothetical protein
VYVYVCGLSVGGWWWGGRQNLTHRKHKETTKIEIQFKKNCPLNTKNK